MANSEANNQTEYTAKNAIYVEFLGNSLNGYSINYERSINKFENSYISISGE